MTVHSNSIADHLSSLELPDVTNLVGSTQAKAEEDAYERAREAYAVATSHPSIENFRAAVREYDDLLAIVKGEVRL